MIVQLQCISSHCKSNTYWASLCHLSSTKKSGLIMRSEWSVWILTYLNIGLRVHHKESAYAISVCITPAEFAVKKQELACTGHSAQIIALLITISLQRLHVIKQQYAKTKWWPIYIQCVLWEVVATGFKLSIHNKLMAIMLLGSNLKL